MLSNAHVVDTLFIICFLFFCMTQHHVWQESVFVNKVNQKTLCLFELVIRNVNSEGLHLMERVSSAPFEMLFSIKGRRAETYMV